MASPSLLSDTIELPPPEHPTTWAHIKDVICRGNLDDLYRDPACERAYRAWSKPVKAEWGSLERFIRVVRLEWDDPLAPPDEQHKKGNGNGSASSAAAARNGFFEDLDDEWLVKMIPNHWPYNIPLGCRHWCVWSRKPITHISQLPERADEPDEPEKPVNGDTQGHARANGRVAPGSPDSIQDAQPATTSSSSASSSSSSASSSKLASAAHAKPVPWPFPAMTRAEQEELYAAVSHDGIRALVLPDEDVRAGPSVAAPVTGEYTLEYFRARPHFADQLPAPPSASQDDGSDSDTAAAATAATSSLLSQTSPLEAAATLAADATMAYFAQHCHSFVLKTFPPAQGWRSVLFCNPPHLRTVPGLDHWHIMSLAPEVGAQAGAAAPP
ncbi:hypothetical protein OC835_006846 [Tilletia horrida]|nr:hypothetical protein OC835_006846 [Tilletia horrida]